MTLALSAPKITYELPIVVHDRSNFREMVVSAVASLRQRDGSTLPDLVKYIRVGTVYRLAGGRAGPGW
jgi:hypothetical protein